VTVFEQRAAVVEEAFSWLRPVPTKFHLGSCTKGVGVDCARLVVACYAAAGVALDLQLPEHTSRSWFLHREDSRFIDRVRAFGHEVEKPLTGDLVIWKIGMSWAHGAIVIDWPTAIQAKWNSGVQLVDCSQKELATLPHLFFSPWPDVPDVP
jgi:cell wall-associated NlpC family hydrolase